MRCHYVVVHCHPHLSSQRGCALLLCKLSLCCCWNSLCTIGCCWFVVWGIGTRCALYIVVCSCCCPWPVVVVKVIWCDIPFLEGVATPQPHTCAMGKDFAWVSIWLPIPIPVAKPTKNPQVYLYLWYSLMADGTNCKGHTNAFAMPS